MAPSHDPNNSWQVFEQQVCTYPFNRQAITIRGCEKDTATPTAKLAQRQGIKYLPLFHLIPVNLANAHVNKTNFQMKVFGQRGNPSEFSNLR